MIGLTLKLSRKFEFLLFYQKIMVCAALLVGLYFFWNVLINQSLTAFRGGFVERSRVLQGEIEEMKHKINAAADTVKNNPQQGLSQQMIDAKKTSEELDKKIHDKTVSMVSPKDMNNILAQVIKKSEDLSVLRIQSLEKKLLVQIKKSDGAQSDGAKNEPPKNEKSPDNAVSKNNLSVFEHGISLEMSGGYFETLNFLKELEKHHLSVVWDAIDYEVIKYPKASIKIVMHTLSLDEDFIGV